MNANRIKLFSKIILVSGFIPWFCAQCNMAKVETDPQREWKGLGPQQHL